MKTILAYGDSLTFGADPREGRHAYEDRWPSVLQAELDGKARVIAEGLGGRTTVFDEYSGPSERNGAKTLPVMLASHSPLDCVAIMLGTNDLKSYVCGSAAGAAFGMKRLAEIVRSHPYADYQKVPEIILMAPPHCVRTDHADLDPMFAGAVEESARFAEHYSRVAKEMGCTFFNAATAAKASPLDGVHLDAENTRAIGKALAPVVKSVLGL